LAKASPQSPIVNSISFLIEEEKEVVEDARSTQQRADAILVRVQDTFSKFNIGVIATIVGFLLSIFTLLGFFLNLTNTTKSDYKEFKKDILDKKYDDAILKLQTKLTTDSLIISEMKKKLDSL
jgi:hypothetical protein